MVSAKQTIYQFKQALGTITLKADQRVIFEEHYISVIEDSYNRCNRSSYLFHTNRVIVTIGSVIVPALLSIQYNQTTTQFSTSIYWCTWLVSLLVTISNGFLTLFKYDKKYFLFHATYAQLQSEGWQYLSLTGNYHTKEPSTHELMFNKFMQSVEKILMRQAQEQFIKLQDVNSGNGHTPTTNSAGIPNLIDTSRSPNQDDLVIKMAKYLQSQSIIGGPSDQNDTQETISASTQTRNFSLRNGKTSSMQLLN